MQGLLGEKRDSFVEMIVHDLKSPVNSGIRAIQILLKDKKFKNNEILIDMLQAARYMKNLVENILYKYRFENSSVQFTRTYYPLNILLSDCVAEIKYLAIEKQQKLILQNFTLRSISFYDILEIKRVVHNLISNAIEHAPKKTDIHIILAENKNDYIVVVENILNGTPPDNLNDIFDKYVSFADKSKRINLGLGLSISKSIIEAHNGVIKAEVFDNNKIRFSFSLPKKK